MHPFYLAETGEQIGDVVVEEVGGIIETAGSMTNSLLSGLPRLATKIIMAALIVAIGALVLRLGRKLINSLMSNSNQKHARNPQQIDTLRSLITSLFNYLMYFIIATMVLSLFGVNVSSMLAVAGVGGVAIAFGAQTLVQDVISGLFIWAEGSLAVGDYVEINGLEGTVESVAVRTTVIRNVNGNLYTLPNGAIRTITNMSRDFKRAIVDIRCPYEESQERLVDIITEEMVRAGKEIDGLDDTPEIWSILAFEPDAVLVRIAAKCPVGQQWRIERDIRTRIKARFDREGIVMPHYQRPPVA